MTGKARSISRQREVSDAVTHLVSFIDIRLTKANVALTSAQAKLPLNPVGRLASAEFERQRGAHGAPGLVIYDVSYDITATDRAKHPVWDLSFTLSLSFRLPEAELADEALEAFGKHGVVVIAHPYAREFVHQMTARMQVPAFVLEVLPTDWQ
jgi:hypothetical protein